MLKALEIIGFKSFAEKTRFAFPPGITVVVGPNGSGKSNIVDSLKWVLGEQSVKSLRGKEMADVIFNGSGSRRAMNSAEITITFDNANHLLPIDTPEVQITRRIYRSGEGEYLINRQPSRLRDIRELLSGTGMGTQAYSVIEQGKVDILLQSSAKDRRLIFEEAAGISLFKAKKVEALRRLERVEQNLLRLSDIVDEVDARLRGVRAQAGKARRYKEHADRLQELRTQVAMVDWHRLTEKLNALERESAEWSEQRAGAAAEVDAIEVRLLDAETRIGEVNESIRTAENRVGANRERIAANEATLDHERRRCRDLEQEIVLHRQRVTQMSARAGDMQQQLAETIAAAENAENHRRDVARQLAEGERELTELMAQFDQIRAEHKDREAIHREQAAALARFDSEISALDSRASAAMASRERNQRRMAEHESQLHALNGELEELRRQEALLSEDARRRDAQRVSAHERLEEAQRQMTAARDDLARRREQHGAVAQRVSILEDLERRHEGLNAGVKEVLAEARNAHGGPFAQVVGLVADVLRVSVQNAPLVEVALGAVAQHVVLSPGDEMQSYLRGQSYRFGGRVSFLWLDPPGAAPIAPLPNLEGRAGVLGRADRFVETESEYAPLARRLLGRTWIVENLGCALELAGSGVRLVTLAGEMLDGDGALSVGPARVAGGLISRRSELRELKSQLGQLDVELAAARSRVETLRGRIGEQQERARAADDEHGRAVAMLGEHRHKITAADERQSQIDHQRRVRQSELESAELEHQEAQNALQTIQIERERVRESLADAELQLTRLGQRAEHVEAQRQIRARATTEVKIELAKSEERLRNLLGRKRQFEENQHEREHAIVENREQLAQCLARARQSQWSLLRAEAEIAELYLRKEAFAKETIAFIQQRDELGALRAELTGVAQRLRSKIRKLEEKIHVQELAAGEIRHERGSLADRLREDYQIELADLEVAPTEEEQHHREEVQAEIDELRRKINNLGNVNLEALAELEELETRYQTLSGQHKDLNDAKNELLRIIDRINTESRRLFSETLETVRGHFQQLFRDLFGGGQADIVLEDDVDILESGIEIVARPPGKEPRSISLLSGGEKTMTCVALLLAIFRSRPSPFCVLDEVDAALDEANIDRFTKVLRDFLAWTQFIIVTHSKKTMTCANTIYGVTMQESGVTKQVSVRFEDVSEDGHILPSALDRAARQEAKDDDTQAA